MFQKLVVISGLAFSSCLTAYPLQAQSAGPSAFGIIVGMSRATVSGVDVLSETKYRTGIVAGVSFARPIRPHVGVEIDALYTDRGYRIASQSFEMQLKTSYLDIPLLLTWNTGRIGADPYVVAGTSINVRLSCTISSKGQRGFTLSSQSVDYSLSQSCDEAASPSESKLARFDIPIVGGVGVRFPVSTMQMSLEARYQYGTKALTNDTDFKNRSMTFSLGVRRAGAR